MLSAVPLVLLIGVPFFLLGILLFRRGYWPRRVGTTPHCRTCGYTLTGLESPRCPECGADTSARSAVVLGERPRRPAVALAGLGCLLLGGSVSRVLIGDPTTRAALDRYKPLWWLVRESDVGDANLTNAGWTEIQRRLRGQTLSAAQIDSLVDHALSLQPGRPYATASERNYFYLLSERAAQRQLSPEQERRYVDGALRAGLKVRGLVSSSDRVPFRVFGNGHGPSSGWWNHASATVQLDGGPPVRVEGVGVPESGQFAAWWMADTLPPQKAGKHHIRATVEVTSVPGTAHPAGSNDRHVTRVLEADFQSIDGQPPIATNTQPPITTPWSRGTVPGPAILTPRVSGHSGWTFVHLDSMLVPPADAAFDCLIRIGEQEYPCGLITFHSGKGEAYELRTQGVPLPLPPTVTLVLRGSADAARRTPDVTSTWVGDLVLPNVVTGGLRPRRFGGPATTQFFRRPRVDRPNQ